MPDEATTGLGEFLDYFWQQTDAYVYVATLDKGLNFLQYVVPWPAKRTGVIQLILANNAAGKDVYFSPVLYKPPPVGIKLHPTKENVLGTHVLWADFDGNSPEDWGLATKEKGIPEPTKVVQSSVKGHDHVYWRLDDFSTNVEGVEDRNRSIAYSLGADTSGWDADQLLRPAFTTNYGYKNGGERKAWFNGDPAEVNIRQEIDGTVPFESFTSLGTPEQEALGRLDIGSLPTVQELLALGSWDAAFLEKFNWTKEEASASNMEKRSGAIMSLGYIAAEHGFSDAQMYTMLLDVDTRWDKYTKRSKAGRDKLLRDIIARARAKIGYIGSEDLTFAGLLGKTKVVDNYQPVYNFQEFLMTDIHIEWLIEGLLAKGGSGVITGQPGVGKTQLGIQLAITLAGNLDEFLLWKNVSGSEKKVLFLSLEMAHAPLKLFIETISKGYSNLAPTLARNLHIAPFGQGISLDKPAGQKYLDSLLSQYKPDVLFIDSLQKMMEAVLTDETATKNMNTYLAGVRERHNCALYFVHHNRKKGNTGESAGELSDMYGSQFFSADADFVLNLARTGRDDVRIDTWKNRLAATEESFNVTRNEYIQYDLFNGSTVTDGTHIVPTTVAGMLRKSGDDDGTGRANLFM